MKKFYGVILVFCIVIIIIHLFFTKQTTELKITALHINGEIGYFLSIKENTSEFHKITVDGKYFIKLEEKSIVVSRKEGNYIKIMEFDIQEALNSRTGGVWIIKNPRIEIVNEWETPPENKNKVIL
jgi:hypothetical protein